MLRHYRDVLFRPCVRVTPPPVVTLAMPESDKGIWYLMSILFSDFLQREGPWGKVIITTLERSHQNGVEHILGVHLRLGRPFGGVSKAPKGHVWYSSVLEGNEDVFSSTSLTKT